MTVQYFLAKTDPETYSIEQFAKEHETIWDGVRNAQALRAIRAMKFKDRVFIYHSMKDAAVVGLAEVAADPEADARDPKLATVRLRLLGRFDPPLSLREIKTSGLFDEWALVRQSRLSTMPAPAEFANWMRGKYPGQAI